MKFVQCTMPSLRTVLVERPGHGKRLEVDVYTPVPVPENAKEQAEIGPRFIPMARAKQLVERGLGSWEWVNNDDLPNPAPILSGPLPPRFPHAPALRAAGFGSLERLPLAQSAIAKIPGLVKSEPGKKPTKGQKDRAAREILDAIDALVRKEEG